MFALGLTSYFFSPFVQGWVLVDAFVASDPIKNPNDPDEDGYKAASIIAMLGITVSLGIFAVLTVQTATTSGVKDATIIAGFAAMVAAEFVYGWYSHHEKFEAEPSKSPDDGIKAAMILAGLLYYLASLAHGCAALQLKGDGPGRGPMLVFAAFGFWWFALGTQMFANYDTKVEEQDNEDTLKAGLVFVGLAWTAAWLANLAACTVLTAVRFKERNAAMMFVLGLGSLAFASMCEAWSKYDITLEAQDNEDTVKAGRVFEALGYTFGWLLFSAAAVFSLSDGNGIVFYGGDTVVAPGP